MSYIPQVVVPTSPPVQLGGTTTDCFLSGSNIVFAQFIVTGTAQNLSMLIWDQELANWFFFPVDPVVADPAVNSGKVVQRYVTGLSPNGIYCTFYTNATYGEGVSAIASVRLVDGA